MRWQHEGADLFRTRGNFELKNRIVKLRFKGRIAKLNPQREVLSDFGLCQVG